MIPVPSTESVELRKGDEYVILGTEGLWKNVSYEQIVQEASSISDPTQVAKRLRDLAVAHGCYDDVSVVVVKLNIDRDPVLPSVETVAKHQAIPACEEKADEDDDEELGITNIDDDLSDVDEVHNSNAPPVTALKLELEPVLPPQEDMDRMVLSAVTAVNGHGGGFQHHEEPMMQSTNFDDLPLSDDSPDSIGPPIMDSTLSELDAEIQNTQQVIARPRHPQPDLHQLSVMTPAEYEAQTLPKITPSSRKSSGLTDFETSFEQTQVSMLSLPPDRYVNLSVCLLPLSNISFISTLSVQ